MNPRDRKLEYREYTYPVRWGLVLRGRILNFCKSYGTTRFRKRVVQFLSTLLDENHQETFEGTIHERYSKDVLQ